MNKITLAGNDKFEYTNLWERDNMSLVHWHPFREMENLGREVGNFLIYHHSDFLAG